MPDPTPAPGAVRGGDLLRFHWFLPTNGGDGRHIVGGGHGASPVASGRAADVPYLGQVARAAEQSGFEAALTPAGAWCEDAWVTTAMLSQVTERLTFLVAFRPGLISPFLAAQTATTFQNLSGGRLLLNVVTGGESSEQRMFGDFLNKQQRYERCDEFLQIVRGLWRGESVDLSGEHLRVEGGRLDTLPVPVPELYFGGSSAEAIEVAARHVETYLTWGEPPRQVAEKIARVRVAAAAAGRAESRPIRFGIRLHVINRDTSQEAWHEADRLLAAIDPMSIAAAQEDLRRS